MADSPKLSTKELAALIEEAQPISIRQALIEEFLRAYDDEHGIKRPAWTTDRSAPSD